MNTLKQTHTTHVYMSTSYWLYIHPELTGKPNYWKVGKSLTPYSAVRSRQRYLVDDFYLTAVWFGHPDDIAELERAIHSIWRPADDKKLGSSRGELIYYKEEDSSSSSSSLEMFIEQMIYSRNSRVKRMYTGNPKGYHATNAGQCCFESDQEKYAHEWSKRKLKELFNIRFRHPKYLFI